MSAPKRARTLSKSDAAVIKNACSKPLAARSRLLNRLAQDLHNATSQGSKAVIEAKAIMRQLSRDCRVVCSVPTVPKSEPTAVDLSTMGPSCQHLVEDLLALGLDADVGADNDASSSGSEEELTDAIVDEWLDNVAGSTTLKRRMARRVRSMTGLVDRYPDLTAAGLTLLELASVEEASLKQYVQQLGLFCDWRHTWREAETKPAEIDMEIVGWMNVEYAKGHKPWRGEKLVASLMALAPTCSKHGTIKLARSFRALKVPSNFKETLGVARVGDGGDRNGPRWLSACSVRNSDHGRLLPATARGYPVKLRRTIGANGAWSGRSVRLFPSEARTRSKTGEAIETIPIDKTEVGFLSPLLMQLRARTAEESIIGISYLEFLKIFTAVARRLKLPLVPSLGRRSGASIDAALGRRGLAEIQRLGRWRAKKSARRYEKMGLLNETWQTMTKAQQAYAEYCAHGLGRTILFGEVPNAPGL